MTLLKNPFRVLSTREIYDNPWIKVFEHQVINPSGNAGVYGVVRFKNQAVGVIPYENGKIWLVGQYRFPLDAYSWEVPEGGSPEGESLEETAMRELHEETGLKAGKLDLLIRMHLSNSVTDEFGVVFIARELVRGTPAPEDTEVLRIREVPLEDAYRMVSTGEITDSLSVAGILRMTLLAREGKL